MDKSKTERGFPTGHFTDRYGAACTIQKSSIATEDCIWLGLDDADPRIMASQVQDGGVGWVKYPIHPDVLLSTRMHLSVANAKLLIPLLQTFVETGELYEE